jgi:hypothetical protein
MPAANPITKINSTRVKANETSLPGHELTLTMALRMVVRRRGLFDGSPAGRLLENSDTAEVALEFIGIPPIVIAPADSSQAGFDSQPLRALEPCGQLGMANRDLIWIIPVWLALISTGPMTGKHAPVKQVSRKRANQRGNLHLGTIEPPNIETAIAHVVGKCRGM